MDMATQEIKRTTSLSLELRLWNSLTETAKIQNCSVDQLVEDIVKQALWRAWAKSVSTSSDAIGSPALEGEPCCLREEDFEEAVLASKRAYERGEVAFRANSIEDVIARFGDV